MEDKFKLKSCTLAEEGINLEFGDFSLLIGYDYPGIDRDAIKDRLEKQGGVFPTIDEALGIYENKDEINKALREAGKPEISIYDWCWTNRPCLKEPQRAWYVGVGDGGVGYGRKHWNYLVRAVSAFHTSKN